MAIRIHDPGHVALRRGIRAAIGVPVAMGLGMWLLPGTPGPLFAAFGALCIIATADFGGPRSRRLLSITGSGAIGLLLIWIGVIASQELWLAVLATFIVTAALAFITVLHGAIASGAPALTTMYVVSVSLGTNLSELGPITVGWLISIIVSIPITLFVLPRRSTAPVREAVVHTLRVLADAVRRRQANDPLDVDAFDEAMKRLHRSYLGNPFRASGLSVRDQSLQILVSQLQGLLAALIRGHGYTGPMSVTASTHELVRESAIALNVTADALEGKPGVSPSGLPTAATWQAQWDEADRMLMSGSGAGAAKTAHAVAEMFLDRAFAISVVRITMLARRVMGLPPEDYAPVVERHSIPEPPVPRLGLELRSHATLRSPWARLALRTGLGLSLAVVVVHFMGLAHGFWVMLGVISVLRFDSLATVKNAVLAIAGTLIGATIGYFLLAIDAQRPLWLWLAFIGLTFLASWAPAAVGFMLGQGAFSLFVIVAFSLIAWPPELVTAGQRVVDIVIGAGVSVVVATLLWPRGILRGLLGNICDAITVGTQLLQTSIDALIDGPVPRLDSLPFEANQASARAREVVELTLSSKSPDAATRAFAWQELMDQMRTLMVAGHLLATWSNDRPPIARYAPSLGPVLREHAGVVAVEWQRVSDAVAHEPIPPGTADPDTMNQIAQEMTSIDLASFDVADRALAAIWGDGWLTLSFNAARAAQANQPTR